MYTVSILALEVPPGSTSLRAVKEKLGLDSSDSGMSFFCKGMYIWATGLYLLMLRYRYAKHKSNSTFYLKLPFPWSLCFINHQCKLVPSTCTDNYLNTWGSGLVTLKRCYINAFLVFWVLCLWSRMLTAFRQEIEKNIDGFGKMVNTKELTGGAKINRIFHVLFPFELVKASWTNYYNYEVEPSDLVII